MIDETRAEVMAEVDRLLDQAQTSQREFDAMLGEHGVTGPSVLTTGTRDAFDLLVGTLRRASLALRREGAQYVKDFTLAWYLDGENTEVSVECIEYDGDDQWTIIVCLADHSRERIIVESDGASWAQVYSSEPA